MHAPPPREVVWTVPKPGRLQESTHEISWALGSTPLQVSMTQQPDLPLQVLASAHVLRAPLLLVAQSIPQPRVRVTLRFIEKAKEGLLLLCPFRRRWRRRRNAAQKGRRHADDKEELRFCWILTV